MFYKWSLSLLEQATKMNFSGDASHYFLILLLFLKNTWIYLTTANKYQESMSLIRKITNSQHTWHSLLTHPFFVGICWKCGQRQHQDQPVWPPNHCPVHPHCSCGVSQGLHPAHGAGGLWAQRSAHTENMHLLHLHPHTVGVQHTDVC